MTVADQAPTRAMAIPATLTDAAGQSAGQSMTLHGASTAGMVMTFEQMRERVEALDRFFTGVMQEGTDYGKIPGTDKPCLFQPGAQLLDGIFGLAASFEELPTTVRDWEAGFFAVDVRCRLTHRQTGEVWAEAIGHCNSKEDRYRWRQLRRICPSCRAEAIAKSKFERGGWYCNVKAGGCGAQFDAGDPAIETQEAGRVENRDTYTLVNTIGKIAQKRAHVGATLNATGASRIFTQDVEDLPDFQRPATRQPTEADVSAAERISLGQLREGYFRMVQEAERLDVTVDVLPDDATVAEFQDGIRELQALLHPAPATTQRPAAPTVMRRREFAVQPAPASAASQQRSAGDLATPNQVRAIYLIARDQHGLSETDLDERCRQRYGMPPAELTRRDASSLIDLLKTGTIETPASS